MHKLFTYGTLQHPEVMRVVTGKTFPTQHARLEGYSLHRLRGLSYPGIRLRPKACVDGLLHTGLSGSDLEALDAFEDAFYRRLGLSVTTSTGAKHQAQVYVIAEDQYERLLPEPWRFEDFIRHDLAELLKATASTSGQAPRPPA